MIKTNLLGITDLDLVVNIQQEQGLSDWHRKTTIAFWKEYSNYGFKFLRKRFSSLLEEDCADIATNATEKMYIKILNGGYQPTPKALSQTFYIKICINAAIDHLKVQNKVKPLLIPEDLLKDLTDEEDKLEWQVEEMLSELEKMSPSSECMALIYGKYLHGKSHEELARERNIKVQSSKNKLDRCLQRLRKAILASKNNYLKQFIKK